MIRKTSLVATVKYLLSILVCASTLMHVEAQSYCHLVKSVGTSFTDTITEPGTYYYSAETFDLPMNLDIISSDPACSTPPELWFDLTCTPGVYTDPKMLELLQDTAKYGISVPMKLSCTTEWVDSLNAYVHHLSLGKKYRNRLKLVGIDYNVTAYVKAVVPCGGVARMEQDTSSMSCVRDARRVALPDSTRVLANDSLSTYLFPFQDWLNGADSVALRWSGPEPAHIWINGTSCEFEIDVQHSWDNFVIPANGEVHLNKSYLNLGLREVQDSTGYLFAKVFSPEEGRLVSCPLVPETKGATLLHYDSVQHVSAGEEAFFCFPISWESMEWVAHTRKKVKLYLHTSPELAAVDSFSFDLEDDARRVLVWSKPEMTLLKRHASAQLLFVRLQSASDFAFTPLALSAMSPCANKSTRLRPGVSYPCSNNSIYGFYYSDWEGYPMEIEWIASKAQEIQNIFIADTCEFQLRWSTTSTKKRCVYYKQTPRGDPSLSIDWNVDSATIAGWKERVTPEGYFYLRMTGGGTITFTTSKPEEEEPEDIPTGCYIVKPETECRKVFRNGQIYIIRGGKAYTITGQTAKIE